MNISKDKTDNRILLSQLSKLGVSELEGDEMKRILNGDKTKNLIPLSIDIAGKSIETEAFLSIKKNPDGSDSLIIHSVISDQLRLKQIANSDNGVIALNNLFNHDKDKINSFLIRNNLLEVFKSAEDFHLENLQALKALQEDLNLGGYRYSKTLSPIERLKIKDVNIVLSQISHQERASMAPEIKIGLLSQGADPYLVIGSEDNQSFLKRYDALKKAFENLFSIDQTGLNTSNEKQSAGIYIELIKEISTSILKLEKGVKGEIVETTQNPDIIFKNAAASFNKVNGVELEMDQVKELKQGKTIEVSNLIDDKGEKYSGFITLNLTKDEIKAFKDNPGKAVDIGKRAVVTPKHDYKIQVNQNNHGIKTEDNKFSNKNVKSGDALAIDVKVKNPKFKI